MMKQLKSKNKALTSAALRVSGILAALCLLASQPVWASEKQAYDDVIINGYALGWLEQMFVENVVGHDIDDGMYVLDVDSGDWGPVDSPTLFHVDLPDDYKAYIKKNFKQPGQAAKVELTSTTEECEAGCLYW